jgi:ActR/RegA family two-component response regulator
VSREVLLIDDDPNYRQSVKVLFKDRTYHFSEASTPAEGVAKIASNPDIRVILLDLSFHGDDGAGVLVLRHIQHCAADYRVIILTGHDKLLRAEQAEAYSVFMYLPKADERSGEAIRFAVDHAFADLERTKPVRPDAEPSGREQVADGKRERVKVFLSYAAADRDRVSEVYDELLSRRYQPWMDVKSIRPGMKWEAEIRKAIEAADFFLFFLSENSALKEGVILKELRQALERQSGLREDSVFIIAARLEQCTVWAPLDEFQYVDLFRPAGMSRLVEALSTRE